MVIIYNDDDFGLGGGFHDGSGENVDWSRQTTAECEQENGRG